MIYVTYVSMIYKSSKNCSQSYWKSYWNIESNTAVYVAIRTADKGNSVVINDRGKHLECVKPFFLGVLFGCYFKCIKCDVLIENWLG